MLNKVFKHREKNLLNKRMRMFLSVVFCLSAIFMSIMYVNTTNRAFAENSGQTFTEEEATAYLDEYSDNVTGDDNFEANLASALSVKRESVSTYGTILALLPPIIAIVLALLTKEVYFSLFIGIISGALIYASFNPVKTVTSIFDEMIGKLSDSWNVGILIFLVVLGIMVCLMNKAGGSAAYARWAAKKIKSNKGAQLATMFLGILIFVDDYFNCLTVGSVMRPVTDTHKVSRAKLAYLIDSTAAPVCIIAPISSWAAAVSSVAPEGEGISLFIKSISYNLYAILTLIMILLIVLLNIDFGAMKKHEQMAAEGNVLFKSEGIVAAKEDENDAKHGKVIDLILPVAALIICCIVGMIFTGGFFEGESFISAFANCDASTGLVLGSFLALVITFILYIPRKVISFKEFAAAIPEGFKAMVPAILILTFAWTLGGMTTNLGAKILVAEFVRTSAAGLASFLPAIVFLVALGLAFATGTSWGTFGILLPIVCAIFAANPELMVITISACLAGAVCGDHCSPISDTTIMASAGAQCNHVEHVSTQLPYALFVAAVSFVGFIVAGLTKNVFITWIVALVLLAGGLFVIKKLISNNSEKAA